MNKPFENKLALVSGASRGIGAAIARRLAADGAWVLVNYAASPARAQTVVADIRNAGGHAEAVQADLSRADGPATLSAAIDQAFGKKAGVISTIPLDRLGTPEELGKAAVFLASDDSAYVTGIELMVDGGAHQY